MVSGEDDSETGEAAKRIAAGSVLHSRLQVRAHAVSSVPFQRRTVMAPAGVRQRRRWW